MRKRVIVGQDGYLSATKYAARERKSHRRTRRAFERSTRPTVQDSNITPQMSQPHVTMSKDWHHECRGGSHHVKKGHPRRGYSPKSSFGDRTVMM